MHGGRQKKGGREGMEEGSGKMERERKEEGRDEERKHRKDGWWERERKVGMKEEIEKNEGYM